MNDQHDFERIVADSVRSIGPVTPSDGAHDLTSSRVRRNRQQPEWLALIKEPPMRTNNHLAVGSPTVRVVAIMAATVLLALALAAAGAGVQRLLAADGLIVVDASGNGDFTTITAAVAVAGDGHEIHVRPGTYTEAVVVGKDITLHGDGPVEEIVVMAPEDGPEWDTQFSWLGEQPYALVLDDVEATVSGMTLRGVPSSLIVVAGAPTVSGMVFDDVGILGFSEGSARPGAVIITGGSAATVSDSEFRVAGGIQSFADSAPSIEGNQMLDGTNIYGDYGEGTIIRGNVLSGPSRTGIRLGNPANALIEGNQVSDRDGGIDGPFGPVEGSIIRDNTVSGAASAAISVEGAQAVSGNHITDSRSGIVWSGQSGVIGDNTIDDGQIGIIVNSGSPTVEDNTVEGMEDRGIAILGIATPVLTGNSACGNTQNIDIGEKATPEIDDTNEICADDLAK